MGFVMVFPLWFLLIITKIFTYIYWYRDNHGKIQKASPHGSNKMNINISHGVIQREMRSLGRQVVLPQQVGKSSLMWCWLATDQNPRLCCQTWLTSSKTMLEPSGMRKVRSHRTREKTGNCTQQLWFTQDGQEHAHGPESEEFWGASLSHVAMGQLQLRRGQQVYHLQKESQNSSWLMAQKPYNTISCLAVLLW